jgi:hypothetical protein
MAVTNAPAFDQRMSAFLAEGTPVFPPGFLWINWERRVTDLRPDPSKLYPAGERIAGEEGKGYSCWKGSAPGRLLQRPIAWELARPPEEAIRYAQARQAFRPSPTSRKSASKPGHECQDTGRLLLLGGVDDG